MIRNLKVLGLALAAVFALSAAIAASASAETPGVITTDGAEVTLDGTELGGVAENFFEYPTTGVRVHCPGSTFPGHKINATPHQPVPNKASEVTITPEYRNCTSQNNQAVPIDMNGCDYRLYDATTTGGVAGTYGVLVDIVCPAGKQIEITTMCRINVPAQNGLTGFHLTNTPTEDLDLSGVAEVNTTLCGFPAVTEQHQNLTITGTNAAGGSTEVTLSHS
ncbi:MAG TPA: hypothetical protein VFN89_03280, partial [Solirubrobacterales bacterium]|nr:hypothetical protein [Solirubrobacterales bacterium]